MSLSAQKIIYGIHSFTPFRRSDGTPYGILKVLKDSSLSLAGELVELLGGSNKYPWAVEDGKITAELTLKFSEYPSFVFELFLGIAPTDNSAEASGSITTAANVFGTTAISATIGIASVSLLSGGSADVKFAQYLIKVITSTTVNIYGYSDVDYVRGTDIDFQDDNLKLLASNLTVTATADTNVASLGIKLTGGSGTIGMTVGDTASFSTRPINTKSSDVIVGAPSNTTPEFSALLVAQKRGTGEMFEFNCYKVKGSGLPIGLAEKAFSQAEVKAKLLYDSAKNGVFSYRYVQPTTV